jgi:hypothetical protein
VTGISVDTEQSMAVTVVEGTGPAQGQLPAPDAHTTLQVWFLDPSSPTWIKSRSLVLPALTQAAFSASGSSKSNKENSGTRASFLFHSNPLPHGFCEKAAKARVHMVGI